MALGLILLFAVLPVSISDRLTALRDESCNRPGAAISDIMRDSCERLQRDSFRPTFMGRDFFFKIKPVPRFHYTDKRVFESIAKQEPVVVTGKWLFKTDVPFTFDYLRSRLANSPVPWTVVQSTTRVFNDTYPEKNFANYKVMGGINRVTMKTDEYYRIYDELEDADNGSRVYMQSNLDDELLHDSVYKINWKVLRAMQHTFSWSQEHTHLVLLSQRDSLTPAHYDYDENIFQQIFGYKRFIFFHPNHYGNIYPHPVHHARDRYTQVDFDHSDFGRFPKLRHLEGLEAELGPGDLLYVPSMWWHMVETATDGPSFSIAFRHYPKRLAYYNSFVHPRDAASGPRQDGAVVYNVGVARYTDPYTGQKFTVNKPDNALDMIHIRRQVEHLIASSTGSYRKVKEVLHEILDGRFEGLEFTDEDP